MAEVMIITGTRKGMGKALAEYYLRRGFTVIGCSRSGAGITHSDYRDYRLDVSDETAVVKFVRAVAREHKRIDVLVNNAGIASMNHLLLTPLKTANRIMDVNFFGTFLLMREVAKVMRKNKQGRIINFSTVAVPFNLEGEAVYAASKSAVESLTKIAARELAEFGVTVNAVGPTPVKTDLIKNVPPEKIQVLLQRQAIKRFGTVDDVCNVIDFFITPNSDFITGQTIYLGGVRD